MAVVRVTMGKNEFKRLPDGRYEGFLSETEVIPPKTEDKFPYVQTWFRTEDPALGEMKVKTIFSFSPKAVWKLVELLDRLQIAHEIEQNVDEDGNVVGETIVFDPEHLDGQAVIAQVTTETRKHNGKEYTNNVVKDFYAPV